MQLIPRTNSWDKYKHSMIAVFFFAQLTTSSFAQTLLVTKVKQFKRNNARSQGKLEPQGNKMIDHTSLAVNNYKESLNFYDKTLGELGYERIITIDKGPIQTAGYGTKGKPSFWISPMGDDDEKIGKARGVHVAFLAESPEQVKNWYHRCLELGATDNGAPGPRPEYHSGYYGAFIVDPDGWRIEACTHDYKGQ